MRGSGWRGLAGASFRLAGPYPHADSLSPISPARGNPRDPQVPKKYYPSIKSTGKVTLPEIMEQVSEISTVSSVDIAAAVEAFLTIIPRELARGNIVQLGDFGSFSLRIKSEGADSEEKVTARNIINVLMTFRPGKRFRKELDDIEFEK